MITFLIVIGALAVYSALAYGYYYFASLEWHESKPWFIFLTTWFIYSSIGDGYEGGDDSLGFGKVACFLFWWFFLAVDLAIIAVMIVPCGVWWLFQIPERRFEKAFLRALEDGTKNTIE